MKQYFQIYLSFNLGFSLRNIITSLLFKVSTSNFKYIFLIITHMLCDKVHNLACYFQNYSPLNLEFMFRKVIFGWVALVQTGVWWMSDAGWGKTFPNSFLSNYLWQLLDIWHTALTHGPIPWDWISCLSLIHFLLINL
jgi:hypothetical protein